MAETLPLTTSRRAIFGGTFDPVHWGHLKVAQVAQKQLQLDEVLWLPSYCPPHKSQQAIAAFHDRWQMVALAIADSPHFAIPALESACFRSSFAIEPLKQLQADDPKSQWYWLLGVDSLRSLPQWVEADELAQRCEWIVAPRPGFAIDAVCQQVAATFARRGIHWRGHLLSGVETAIASRTIRQAVGNPDRWQAWVPPTVARYIQGYRLYRTRPSAEAESMP